MEAFGARFFRALARGLTAAAADAELWAATQAAATAIADRVVGGGSLFLADGRGDFTSEGVGRAGGLMLLRGWSVEGGHSLGPRDTVIVGVCGDAIAGTDRETEAALLVELGASAAVVIHLGNIAPGGSAAEHELPLSPPATALFGAETYPFVSLLNISWLWVLTAEAVAALSRRHEMPAMYQSIQNLGSTERNERARDGADPRGLYTNHDVPAVAPEELGRQYLSALLSSLRALETTEAEAMEAATAHCAAVVSAGRRVFPFLISHFPPHQWGCPGDPMLMEPPVSFLEEGKWNQSLELKKLVQ